MRGEEAMSESGTRAGVRRVTLKQRGAQGFVACQWHARALIRRGLSLGMSMSRCLLGVLVIQR